MVFAEDPSAVLGESTGRCILNNDGFTTDVHEVAGKEGIIAEDLLSTGTNIPGLS